MLIIMINNDENNWSTNDYNGDQAITIFQAIHFREPLISKKPRVLALNHVYLYGYWCCQGWILSVYDDSVMFLQYSY